MTSGFGVDAAADGSSGTSASDIRKINGGLYTPGIVSGCRVTTSASGMEYTVSAGVVAIQPVVGEIILAPVETTTIPADPAPASGTRQDVIYVQQRYPSIEGDAVAVVRVGPTLPERAVEILKYNVPAGVTNTNGAIVGGGQHFSIPRGGSLGELYYNQLQNTRTLPSGLERWGHGQIDLPTDRMVTWSITAVLSAQGASGFDNSKYCEYGFLPNYDGGDWVLWTTPGLHQAWQTVYFSNTIPMGAGVHNVSYGILRMIGPGTGVAYYGLDSQGFGRRGIEFRLVDAGPVV